MDCYRENSSGITRLMICLFHVLLEANAVHADSFWIITSLTNSVLHQVFHIGLWRHIDLWNCISETDSLTKEKRVFFSISCTKSVTKTMYRYDKGEEIMSQIYFGPAHTNLRRCTLCGKCWHFCASCTKLRCKMAIRTVKLVLPLN